MATIEILSGDFERETTRIRYSEAGRAYLRLKSTDGRVEDLFLESEVVGAAVVGDGPCVRTERTGERDKRLFVVLLRGGRKFAARGDHDAFLQFEDAALPADRRRCRTAAPASIRGEEADPVGVARLAARFGQARFGAWIGSALFARLLPGGR